MITSLPSPPDPRCVLPRAFMGIAVVAALSHVLVRIDPQLPVASNPFFVTLIGVSVFAVLNEWAVRAGFECPYSDIPRTPRLGLYFLMLPVVALANILSFLAVDPARWPLWVPLLLLVSAVWAVLAIHLRSSHQTGEFPTVPMWLGIVARTPTMVLLLALGLFVLAPIVLGVIRWARSLVAP